MKFDDNLINSMKECLNYCGELYEKKKMEAIINNILFLQNSQSKIMKKAKKFFAND